ncbi:histidine kinase [Teredinibacter waterburyi]|uniref:histidine kinase n=1 Tax=Teredinibacter waterburyi TaxID=1500538 RepID=UPI00165F11F4|nr:histidine kinase [Teredinibacter waterburyi]
MKTLAFGIFLLALVVGNVESGEVGAFDPRIDSTTSSIDVALAEIGASGSWETRQDEFQVVPNRTIGRRDMAKLNKHLSQINTQVSSTLDDLIEQRTLESLRF